MATSKNLDSTIGSKITELRGDETQESFAKKLGVDQPRINGLEKGRVVPSNSILVKLGNIATDAGMRLYFWEKAGLETDHIEAKVRARFIKRREKSLPGESVLLTARGGEREENDKRRFAFPATRIPNPESTFCIEIGKESHPLPSPLDEGGLAVVDSSRTELLRTSSDLLAVQFDVIPNLRPQALNRASARLLQKHEDTTPPEFLEKYGPKPGVRFGRRRLVTDVSPGGAEWAWCFFLEYAPEHNTASLPLTEWHEGNPPSEAELEKSLMKSVHVLGTVIGWIAAPGSETKPPEGAAERKVKV
jgi:transcriptional regulator with XRE-family HTH domain